MPNSFLFSFSESLLPHGPQRKPHESSKAVTCQSDFSWILQSIQVSIPKLKVNLVTDFVCKASSSRLLLGNEFPSLLTEALGQRLVQIVTPLMNE